MKHLTLFFFVCALISCSKKEDATPKYTSIEGVWKISGDATGQIEIVNYSGKMTADDGPGNYYVSNGVTQKVTKKGVVNGVPPAFMYFDLMGTGENALYIKGANVNKTYTEMTTAGSVLYVNRKNTNVSIKLTR